MVKIRKALAVVTKLSVPLLLALTAYFYFMFYDQYFKWRGCFNSLDRCFDPETGVVYSAQSGMVWLWAALFFTALSLMQLWRLLR